MDMRLKKLFLASTIAAVITLIIGFGYSKQLVDGSGVLGILVNVLPNSFSGFIHAYFAPIITFIFSLPLATAILSAPKIDNFLITKFWPDRPKILLEIADEPENDMFDPNPTSQVFVGRLNELNTLQQFVDSDWQGQKWIQIEGKIGIGKTRLAHEFLRALKSERKPIGDYLDTINTGRKVWDVGVLAPLATIDDVNSIQFRKPTAILVDNVRAESTQWSLITGLLKRGQLQKQSVKIIVISDDEFENAEEFPASETSFLARKVFDPIILGSLSPQEAIELALTVNVASDEIVVSTRNPLLIRLGTNPWAELRKRAIQILNSCKSSAEKELVVLSCLAGPFPEELLPNQLKNISYKRRRKILNLPSSLRTRGTIDQLTPKLLAGEIFFFWISEHQDEVVRKTLGIASRLSPQFFRRRLSYLFQNRPEREDTISFARKYSHQVQLPLSVNEKINNHIRAISLLPKDWSEAIDAEFLALRTSQHELGVKGDLSSMFNTSIRIKNLLFFGQGKYKVDAMQCDALACLISHIKLAKYFDLKLDAILHLDSICEAHNDDPLFKTLQCSAYYSWTVPLAENWNELSDPDKVTALSTGAKSTKMHGRLWLEKKFDLDIGIKYAGSLVNMLKFFAEHPDIPSNGSFNANSLFAQLEEVYKRHQYDEEVGFRLSKGANNLTGYLRSQRGNYSKILELTELSGRISQQWQSNPNISARFLQACIQLVSYQFVQRELPGGVEGIRNILNEAQATSELHASLNDRIVKEHFAQLNLLIAKGHFLKLEQSKLQGKKLDDLSTEAWNKLIAITKKEPENRNIQLFRHELLSDQIWHYLDRKSVSSYFSDIHDLFDKFEDSGKRFEGDSKFQEYKARTLHSILIDGARNLTGTEKLEFFEKFKSKFLSLYRKSTGSQPVARYLAGAIVAVKRELTPDQSRMLGSELNKLLGEISAKWPTDPQVQKAIKHGAINYWSTSVINSSWKPEDANLFIK